MIFRRDGIIFMHLEDPVWGGQDSKILQSLRAGVSSESVSSREEAILIPQVSDHILDSYAGDQAAFHELRQMTLKVV